MNKQLHRYLAIALLVLAGLLPAGPAEAVIVYVGESSGRNDALPTDRSPGALTIPKPPGTTAGMTLIASIAARPRNLTVVVPPGWVQMTFTNQTNGGVSTLPGGMSLITYYKIVGTTEPNNYTWTLANEAGSGANYGGGAVGGILSFSGVDTSTGDPLDVWGAVTTGNGNTHTAPAILTTQPNTLVVSSISYLSAGTFGNPTNTTGLTVTERLDVRAPDANTAIGTTLQMSTAPKASGATSTGSTSATANGNADTGVGHHMALKPASIDAALSMTRSGPLVPGSTASYAMIVTNNGSDDEPGPLSIVLTLPTGLSFNSATGSGWSCSAAGQVITCTRAGAVASGATAPTLTVTVNVASAANGVLTTSATVSGRGGDGNTSNNTATNTYILPSQPYAYYAMDESTWGTVTDSSGNGRNASALGSAAPTGFTVPIGSALSGNPGTCGAGRMPDASGNGVNTNIDVNNLGNSGTIMFWYASSQVWNNGTSRILLDASNNLGNGGADKHFFLAKDGTGRLVFAIEDSNDTDSTATSVSYAYAANTWHHIAVTWDVVANRIAIYLDGDPTPVATSTTTLNNTLGDMATLYLAAQRMANVTGTPGAYTANGANGYIDELRLYTSALAPLEIEQLADDRHACPGSLDHVRLNHTGTGLTCLASSVTVTACSSVDSAGVCTVNTSGLSGNVLARDAGSAIVATVPFSIAAGSSTVVVSVPVATAQTVSFETGSLSTTPVSSPAWSCWNGSTASCSHVYSSAGFIFATAAGGPSASIPTQIAGTSSATLYLRAVRTSTTTKACEAALAGANSVNFAYECNNPSTCSASNLMAINGGTSTTIQRNNNSITPRTFISVPMTFDANGDAPFTLNYRDAGQVTLWASKAASGALLSNLAGASNAFVVKPASLVAAATTPAGGANPGTTTTGGGAFVIAANPFTVNVQGYTSGGAVTPNFGNESTTPTVTFVDALNAAGNIHDLVVPTANTPSRGTLTTGTISNGNGSGVTGTVRVTANSWSEVGAITLKPHVADYLGAGAVTGAVSGTIGRFRPAAYAVSGTVSVCSSPTFVYVGQPLTGTLTITAQNAVGNTTVNYGKGASSLATLGPSQLTLGGLSVGLALDTGSALYNLVFAAGQNFNTRVDGTAQVTAALPVRMTAAPAAPISSALQLTGVTDEVGSVAGAPVSLLTSATTPFRLGRLNLLNAYGSDALPLLVPVRAEFFNGTTWTVNTADNCTALSAASLGAGNVTQASGSTLALNGGSVALTSPALVNGMSSFRITPTTRGPGSVDLVLNLGFGLSSSVNWCGSWANGPLAGTGATPASSLAFLAGNWCGAATDRAPAARVRFGSPRAPYIYLRERY